VAAPQAPGRTPHKGLLRLVAVSRRRGPASPLLDYAPSARPCEGPRGRQSEAVRRDRRRRRSQRTGRGRVSGQVGRAHAGARSPRAHRRGGHDRGTLARCPTVPGDPALLRDEPDAADHHQRPRPAQARLQDLPDGPVLPGVSRGRLDQAVRRRRQAQPRRGGQVVGEGRRRHAPLGRLAGRPGRSARPAAAHRAAAARIPLPPATWPARCAWPGGTAASTCARSRMSPG